MNLKRVRKIQDPPIAMQSRRPGKVLYWMSRDMRMYDNWAMVFADKLAKDSGKTLEVGFWFFDKNKYEKRVYDFFLAGIEKVREDLQKLGINWVELNGKNLEEYSDIVFDFSPLLGHKNRLEKIKASFMGTIWEVDAHNIVPCWVASNKLEFGAYTLRPKIHKLLPEFLDEYPEKWKAEYIHPVLQEFVDKKELGYASKRNDPTAEGTSNLSAYLHFGHISTQRVALSVKSPEFLEELIVRRELADNYCYYQKNYKISLGYWPWAIKSLDEHSRDKRQFVYTQKQFENAQTHDELWNAAQKQMVVSGKMHGYMRMYWAKKILEWSKNYQEAHRIAVYLNDKYELDGRDPNGYTGIAWSIGGVHDRAWFERPIFGKIRYMSRSGCEKKFDVKKYIETWL